jgi:hypothetical protein
VYNNPLALKDPSGHGPEEITITGRQPRYGFGFVFAGSWYAPSSYNNVGTGPVGMFTQMWMPQGKVVSLQSAAKNLRNISWRNVAVDPRLVVPRQEFLADISGMAMAHMALNAASIALDATLIGAVISWIPDVLDGVLSATEGDWTGAALSAAAAIPGFGDLANAGKMARVVEGIEAGLVKSGAGKTDGIIHVTKEGVALPPGQKYQIPGNYVQNPYGRTGSYGEIESGKFRERLRIDPATPPGQKGPNYSHYHLDGRGSHYSPGTGDKDPGFGR